MTSPAQAALFAAGDGDLPVAPAPVGDDLRSLAQALHARYGGRLHLGTSSWHFPGWAGCVWSGHHPPDVLSRYGLAAYARHPLLRTVSLDRAFYRPLETSAYAVLAAQVPADFRFVVKAPALVTDARRRDRMPGPNPLFLDADTAVAACVTPSLQGLHDRLGAIVFQLSPLPDRWLADEAALHERLDALCRAVAPQLPRPGMAAIEVRDAPLLTPALASLLKSHGVRYCLGLHDRMPAADAQLPMLRALWPGDLVCRWNLQRGCGYEQAKADWSPFDRLQAPDPATRHALARALHGTLSAGFRAIVTINNKAEGSAPRSVEALARALLALGDADGD